MTVSVVVAVPAVNVTRPERAIPVSFAVTVTLGDAALLAGAIVNQD